MPSLHSDPESIRASIALFLKPGAVAELRAPKSDRDGTISGYFSDPEALVRAALEVNGKAPGVYVTLNPVNPDALARSENRVRLRADKTTGDMEITQRFWLLFDFDPDRLTGISSTDAEHEAALAAAIAARDNLSALGWPDPVYGDSGNGGHLVYRISLPNNEESTKLIQSVLKVAAGKWGTPEIKIDITVFNASRISKIYGTLARKGDSTPERPHRISRLLSVPTPLVPVPVELLQSFAAEAQPEPKPPSKWSGTASDFRLEDFLSRHGIGIHRGPIRYDGGEKWQLKACPFNPEHKAPDSAIFRNASGRLGFRCLHNSCADQNWESFRDFFEPNRPKTPAPSRQHLNGNAANHVQGVVEDDPDSHLLALCDEIIASGQSHRMYEKPLFDLISRSEKHTGLQVRTKLRKHFGKEMVLSGPGSWPELYREAVNVRARRSQKTPELEDNPDPRSLVEIQTSNRQLRDISLESIQQIKAKNDPPSLFVRSGTLVHVIQDEKERPTVSIVTEARLRGVLARTANFMKIDRFGELKNAFPPIDVVKDILAFNPQSWPFPPLSSVAEVPTLRPDGTILDQPGYDPESAIYYAPASTLKSFPLPAKPTQADVVEARRVVDEAIGEFPYADDASRANIYGLLLTPVLRPAIRGCAPLAVVDAPQAGTGKSLLIDVLSIITTGRPAAMMPYPYKEEEMQKQIAASLSAGRQLIVFDNLEGELRSPALALAITAKEFEARILGISRNMTVENQSTWVVTGNNIKPAGDMPRRCYQIRLNAQDSRPYMGRTFKHANLLQWVTENRSQILHSLLVIARFWFSEGARCHVTTTAGSFEHWHRTVGSIVEHARINGFLSNYSAFIEQEDDSPRQWEGFLHALFREYPDDIENVSKPFQIADLLARIQAEGSSLSSQIPNEIADCLEKRGANHRISVGKMLRSRRERRFGYRDWQYWLERVDGESDHKGSAAWKVCRVSRQKRLEIGE